MKKTLFIIILLVYSISTWAQNDITRFLGIPVDGTKEEMIEKLKAKGFSEYPHDQNFLYGKFNGRDVLVQPQTSGNKVWRIFIIDATPSSKADIKTRYNELCRQFMNNPGYLSPQVESDVLIPDNEDIQANPTDSDRRHEAFFWQLSPWDTEKADSISRSKYTDAQKAKLTSAEKQEMKKIIARQIKINQNKLVWFTILYDSPDYYIMLFYENKNNKTNGENPKRG